MPKPLQQPQQPAERRSRSTATCQPPLFTVQFQDAATALHRRAQFVSYLRAHGRPQDDYAAAEVIFDELVSNVCFHAPGRIEVLVEWRRGQAALHVSDEGLPIDITALPRAKPYDEHGRGLAIVRALSPTLRSTIYADQGKTLSVMLPIWSR
jgi:anti-sigma regulatory factor (Ser/Thr protein kinase)